MKKHTYKHTLVIAAKPYQQGLSLIELMVALSIGIFLLAGILQVTLGSRQAFEVIQAQSTMQEGGRFGMSFIANTVRQTGYLNVGTINLDNTSDFAQSIVNANDIPDILSVKWPLQNNFQAQAVVEGSDNAAAAGWANAKANTDDFTVRLQGDPDGFMRDCEGKTLSAVSTEVIRATFFVDSNNNLNCQVQGIGFNNGAVQLVTGIEDMQVLYGVAVDPTVSNRAGRYVRASDVTATDWPNVVSMRVALLTISDNSPLDSSSKNYTLLDKAVNGVTDGRARQSFTQTIALRNRMAN